MDKGFLYAKIGDQDDLAFPELLPGSIVRINPKVAGSHAPKVDGELSRHLFLIEQKDGLLCCHIRNVGNGRIVPASVRSYSPQMEVRIPQDATLVGAADMEIRRIIPPPIPESIELRVNKSAQTAGLKGPQGFGELLRAARLRMRLSFRAASAKSRRVATLLDDGRYFVSPGALADYEGSVPPPRHLHKFISFSLIYSVPIRDLMSSVGLRLNEAGKERIPSDLIAHPSTAELVEKPALSDSSEGALGELIATLHEVPFFIRTAVGHFSGLTNPGLKDFFWIGETRKALHPFLAGGLMAVVNRQKKRPNHCSSKPLWQQALFVILKRDGTYLCACSERQNDDLIVHSYDGSVHRLNTFRGGDAEVIGQIVAVVRRLP
jgi:hypothetical protein